MQNKDQNERSNTWKMNEPGIAIWKQKEDNLESNKQFIKSINMQIWKFNMQNWNQTIQEHTNKIKEPGNAVLSSA
jgi:hypothetical protein